jgi:hypothetical protein
VWRQRDREVIEVIPMRPTAICAELNTSPAKPACRRNFATDAELYAAGRELENLQSLELHVRKARRYDEMGQVRPYASREEESGNALKKAA